MTQDAMEPMKRFLNATTDEERALALSDARDAADAVELRLSKRRSAMRRQWQTDNENVKAQFGLPPMSWQQWLSYLDETEEANAEA